MPIMSPVPLPLWSPQESHLLVESCVEAEENLIARILATREAIENRPRIFKSVRKKRGRRFEELT
jgi:hypothetical protein